MPRVALTLSEKQIEAIKSQPDFDLAPGRSGGVGGWIAALVARQLGTERRDYHEERSLYWAEQARNKWTGDEYCFYIVNPHVYAEDIGWDRSLDLLRETLHREAKERFPQHNWDLSTWNAD